MRARHCKESNPWSETITHDIRNGIDTDKRILLFSKKIIFNKNFLRSLLFEHPFETWEREWRNNDVAQSESFIEGDLGFNPSVIFTSGSSRSRHAMHCPMDWDNVSSSHTLCMWMSHDAIIPVQVRAFTPPRYSFISLLFWFCYTHTHTHTLLI